MVLIQFVSSAAAASAEGSNNDSGNRSSRIVGVLPILGYFPVAIGSPFEWNLHEWTIFTKLLVPV